MGLTGVRRALSRARYAGIGGLVGGAVGGLVSRNAASTGAAAGAFLGAALGETSIDVRSRLRELRNGG